jgi:hypothetical protein
LLTRSRSRSTLIICGGFNGNFIKARLVSSHSNRNSKNERQSVLLCHSCFITEILPQLENLIFNAAHSFEQLRILFEMKNYACEATLHYKPVHCCYSCKYHSFAREKLLAHTHTRCVSPSALINITVN